MKLIKPLKTYKKIDYNLEHFFDEEGELIKTPRSTNLLGQFITSIIEESTKNLEDNLIITKINCRRRPKRKPCNGIIVSKYNYKTQSIDWTCSKCGDESSIYNWQYSEWDKWTT